MPHLHSMVNFVHTIVAVAVVSFVAVVVKIAWPWIAVPIPSLVHPRDVGMRRPRLTLPTAMMSFRHRTSMWRMVGWRIRQAGRIMHQRLTLIHSRIHLWYDLPNGKLPMQHRDGVQVDVDIILEGGHPVPIQVHEVCVRRMPMMMPTTTRSWCQRWIL